MYLAALCVIFHWIATCTSRVVRSGAINIYYETTRIRGGHAISAARAQSPDRAPFYIARASSRGRTANTIIRD